MEYDAEQATLRMIQKQTALKDKSVLEIGCGSGDISSLLADDARRYIGVDPDEKTIREAQEKYGNVDFRVGNGEFLVFEDSLFDLVLFTLSLHHQNSAVALKEAYRVLKDHGRLVIIEPSPKGEFQQFFHLFDDETVKIRQAYQSMLDSAFTLEDKGRFEAIVRFEGKTDLCSYGFDRKRAAPGDEDLIMNKLAELQPGASHLSPIVLIDVLDIYLMAKA